VDESGINKFLYREDGWAKCVKKVLGAIAGKRYMRESFIAGLVENKVMFPLCYQGTCDTALFNY
jgi:isftu1 transposase